MLSNTLSSLELITKWGKYRNSNYVFLAIVAVFTVVYILDNLTSKSITEIAKEVVMPYLYAIKNENYLEAYNEYTSDRFKGRYSYEDFLSAYQERINNLGEFRYFLLEGIEDERYLSVKLIGVFRYGSSGEIELQLRRQWGNYYIDDTFEKVGNSMKRKAW